jgi:hypothetical protein
MIEIQLRKEGFTLTEINAMTFKAAVEYLMIAQEEKDEWYRQHQTALP